jgi:hypothetical protein
MLNLNSSKFARRNAWGSSERPFSRNNVIMLFIAKDWTEEKRTRRMSKEGRRKQMQGKERSK